MPITDEIVCVGPTGDMLCYILPKPENRIQPPGSKKDIDAVVERYIRETKSKYPGKDLTREELEQAGWVTVFCVEDGCFWAYDAEEC